VSTHAPVAPELIPAQIKRRAYFTSRRRVLQLAKHAVRRWRGNFLLDGDGIVVERGIAQRLRGLTKYARSIQQICEFGRSGVQTQRIRFESTACEFGEVDFVCIAATKSGNVFVRRHVDTIF
jgi:hypothetical protein